MRGAFTCTDRLASGAARDGSSFAVHARACQWRWAGRGCHGCLADEGLAGLEASGETSQYRMEHGLYGELRECVSWQTQCGQSCWGGSRG